MANHVAELINKWNSNKNGAVYRDRLQEFLSWDPESDVGLGDLVESHFKKQFQSERVLQGLDEGHRRVSPQSQRLDYKKMWSLIEEREGKVSKIIEPILVSGWNFEDIREEGKGRFDREPNLNEDFLRDMAADDPYIDEMSPAQIGLLSALFKAWRYWHRRQSEQSEGG